MHYSLTTRIMRYLASDKGASLTEYALVALLIAIAALIALRMAGAEVSGQFSTIASGMVDAGSN